MPAPRTSSVFATFVAVIIAIGASVSPASARMTVIYDVADSVNALLGPQPGGTAGLSPDVDGLFQQQPAPVLLPQNRQVGKVSGGAGSALTPNIKGMTGPEMAALFVARVDAAGANIMFVDELGQGTAFAGVDGANLDVAMIQLSAIPFPGGGTYADRVHMYVNPALLIADPAAWSSLWHAMSLTGGVWFEGYQGMVQWSPEHWLAWPRMLRDGLVARGMSPDRIHVIVRGAGQAAIWQHMRTGAACGLLANGPGAYRTLDQVGFVREFRATFGTAPAPAGPSPVSCLPAPVLSEPRAGELAAVLELERRGASVTTGAVAPLVVPVGAATTVAVSLGADPLGLAARLGVAPATFWATAQARLIVTGPGIDLTVPLGLDGRAEIPLAPAAAGPIDLRLALDGLAVRQAVGTPVDLAVSLQLYATRIAQTLDRIIANPVSWSLAIPLATGLRAEIPAASGPAPASLRLTTTVLRRRLAPRLSSVRVTASRPASRLLVEVGVIRNRRFVPIRRLRITGTRVVVGVRLPRRGAVRARVVPDQGRVTRT